MPLRLVDSLDSKYAPVITASRRFLAEWESCSDFGANRLMRAALAGSHAKALDNSRSDIDVTVYYALSVPNLLKVRRHTVSTHPKPPLAQVEREAVTYSFEGGKYEVVMVPLRSVGGGDRDLWTGLAKQNIDLLFKFLRSYELRASPEMDAVREFLLSGFHLEPEAAYAYFDGYGTSQLMRHRKESGERRAKSQTQVNEVVKSIVDGVGMMLAGTLLLDRQELSYSFEHTLKRYESHFSSLTFLWRLWEHKTDRRPIDEGESGSFLASADSGRESLMDECKRLLKTVKEGSSLRDLTEAEKKSNQERLDQLFLKAHRVEE